MLRRRLLLVADAAAGRRASDRLRRAHPPALL
jgi:hypothetical protein